MDATLLRLNPEAQTLIERLSRMDPACPKIDRMTVEAALRAHFRAVGLRLWRCRWFPDAKSAHAHVQRAHSRRWVEIAFRTIWAVPSLIVSFWLWNFFWPHIRAYPHTLPLNVAALAACNLILIFILAGASGLTIRAITSIPRFPTYLDRMARHREAAYRIPAIGEAMAAGWQTDSAADDLDAQHMSAAAAARSGSFHSFRIARLDAGAAVRDLKASAVCAHPALAKIIEIELPLLEAFTAGLFLYSIIGRQVICVPLPVMSVVGGQLHRADGPAVWWPTGERHFFWKGVSVPAWVIEEPGWITVDDIRSESDQDVRRCMIEIYGRECYLRERSARLIDEDRFGRLWEVDDGGSGLMRLVEVENGTPDPDGTRRTYILDVTDAAEELGWPVETARAAVAATYGLREKEYRPEVRT